MKIKAFGVGNWDDEKQFFDQLPILKEWSERIYCFVPNIVDRICITPGSYSPVTQDILKELDQLKIDVIQTPFFRRGDYSRINNYFRLGFMTGIWHSLLLDKNADTYELPYDLILHCQCRTLIGEDMSPYIESFMERSDILMAPMYTSKIGTSVDVGCMFMKPYAAKTYLSTGFRQSCDQDIDCMNCEYEAFLMFAKYWYNPWPNLLSTKQKDSASTIPPSDYSIFRYNNIEDFCKLPIISVGDKHIEKKYFNKWKKNHKILK